MAQACDGYTKTSLMGNYYEQRLAPTQAFRESDKNQINREKEDAISFPGPGGQLIPLPTVKRNQPWVTKGVTADDGFKEFRSNANTNFDPKALTNYKSGDQRPIIQTNKPNFQKTQANPTSIQLFSASDYKLISPQNLKQVETNRQGKINVTNFGSTFNQHPETHEKFFGVTTYQNAHSVPMKQSVDDVIEQFDKTQYYQNGINQRPVEKQGTQMTSVLIAEQYQNLPQPQDNTRVQRSWLPYPDKGLVNAEKNLEKNDNLLNSNGLRPASQLQTYKSSTSQMPTYNNANSLPLENGQYDNQFQYTNPGQFRHVRSEITLVRNNALTQR